MGRRAGLADFITPDNDGTRAMARVSSGRSRRSRAIPRHETEPLAFNRSTAKEVVRIALKDG